jgi:hypothetical protein
MAEIYGHKWVSAYGDSSDADGAAGTWAKGLAGITPQQVAEGLKACVVSSDPWPPTLPEFRAMCLGIPSFPAVSMDVAKVQPFTRLVWAHMDGHLFRMAPAEKASRMLRDAYELAREHVMRGGELPEPSAGEIEADKPAKPVIPETREERHTRIEKAQRELSGRDLADGEGTCKAD